MGIYAVKTTMTGVNPTEVVTVTPEKKQSIRDIFWDMNSVSVKTFIKTETKVNIDENGDEQTINIEKTTINVNVCSEDYEDASKRLQFDNGQNTMLNYIIAPANYPLFASLAGVDCYGGLSSDEFTNINLNLPTSDIGTDIVRYALTRLGDPYSKTKRGQGRYVDCSYFVRWAYQQAGVNQYTPGTAAEQARWCENHNCIISKTQFSKLQPGDVIFWAKHDCQCAGDHCGRYKGIHHTGLYIGNGKLIEASSSKGRVVIRDVWEMNGGKWEIEYFARPLSILDLAT